MNGIWKKLLSLFLALTLALQLLPVQAMAAELQESESLTVEDRETTVTEDATIVAEVPSGRDEFQKEFILSNGLRMISINGSAVHYQEDGEWKEIDNTLLPISATGAVLTGRAAQTSTVAYKNTAGIWDVKLPASLNANNAVEVSRDGYTLSFKFAGEIHNNHVVMSVGDEIEFANVQAPVVESAQEEGEMEAATSSEEPSELSETAEQESDEPSAEGSEVLNETTAVDEPVASSEGTSEEPAALASETVTESIGEASETIVAEQVVATVTTQVSVANAAVLDLSSTASAAPQQEYMDKLYSAVAYSDIYSNTDLRYDLQSHQLKESVIIKQAKDTLAGYKYTLSAPGMVLELQEDNSILAYTADAEEGDEPIFYMPAPFLVDDNLSYNDNIAVSLQQSGDTYTLTYSLPRAWLLEEERAYPVVLDPIITPDRGKFDIEDQTVFSAGSMSYTWGCVATGYSKNLGKARTLIRFTEIPKLTSADVIVSADISFYLLETNATTLAMEAHKVLNGGWRSSSVTWSDMNDAGVDYNPAIEDYALVKSADWYEWDITDVARGWYETGVNSGVMFKVTDTIENAGVHDTLEFCSSDWGGSKNPYLNITYLNNCGLEDYWDYTSQSAGRAGTGHVSNFTGNLVWIHNGLSFAGNRMPVSISHVYNANDKSNNNYGLGYGWRTNYNQRVYQWTEDSTYYVWEDQDGTRRYFKYSSSGTYKNEIDNTLVLTTTGSGDEKYRITDKNGNKSYFDADGRLKKICNNQQTVSSITIAYSGTTKRITSVTDGAGRVYTFNYNDSSLLSSIIFKGTGATAISTLSYAYDSSSNLTCITYPDGNSVYYCYNSDHEDVALSECAAGDCGGSGAENHLLHRAFDVDGYRVEYAYTASSPHRVTHIAEFDGSTAGGSLDIEYAHNQTTFVDHNGNKEIVQFNNYGSMVSIQDGQGRAQFAQYKSESDAKSASQLTLSSKLQNTVVNLAHNGGFETEDSWVAASSNASDGSWDYDSTINYLGAKSLKITRTADDTAYSVCSASDATYPIEPGKSYTLSAYVKTSDMGVSGGGAKIALKLSGNSEDVATSKAIKVDSDWTRLEATYSHPESAVADTLAIHLINLSSGSAYFDCVQLEESVSASRYNLVENGDFRNGAIGWAKNSSCAADDTVYDPENDDEATPDLLVSAAPQLDTTYYRIIGSATSSKTVSRSITLSGSEGDVFTLGGWAKGDSVPLSNDRKFGLAVTFIDSDGVAGQEHLVSFNPDSDSNNNWQYAATRVIADKNYASVRVDLLYCKNQNIAYFDGIQLYKEEFGQSYDYDENGNVRSVIDLQQQETTYEYSNNNLTKMVLPGDASQTYTYDSYHNVLTATSPEGVISTFTYDSYGNNTSVTLGDLNWGYGIVVSATYTSNGNLLATVTDQLENTTIYGYNTQTGVLEWVQAPNESEYNRAEYNYDSLYRTTSVSQGITEFYGGSLNGTAAVTYTYDADLLDTITSASGTVYDFAYTTFDLVQSVKAGSRTLISHEYSASPNFYLTKSTYGNGDYISYTYDNLGRTTSKTYGNVNDTSGDASDTVSYDYDNNGNLGLVTDSATGRTTKYLYDFQDRLSRYEETGTGYSSSVEWEYDTKNNLTTQTHVLNGTEYVTSYDYDDDNRLIYSGQGDTDFSYNYDAWGRLNNITVNEFSSLVLGYSVLYHEPSSVTTTTHISEWDYLDNNGEIVYFDVYNYDSHGNITEIGSTSMEDYDYKWITYSYDNLNQLLRVDNEHLQKSWVYTYDEGGNILSKKEYPYLYYGDEPEWYTPLSSVTYTYGDATWKDLLTAINGQPLTYDGIGNLLTDGTWNYTWEHGRRLASMSKTGTNIAYAYNADGMRISKTVNGTIYNYHYLGDQLVEMTWGNNKMSFIYNTLGPAAVIYNGTTYYYKVNAQGDVIGILDSSGNTMVEYTYDAWGKLLDFEDDTACNLGALNPFRYRGYVYDTETGLYYLQSRYYNPSWGRFINADGYASTGQGIIGNNMFAYCNNNPVMYSDSTGHLPFFAITAAIGATVGAIVGGVSAAKAGKSVLKGALNGAAIGGLIGLGAGAAGAALITGNAAATTAAVLGTASVKLAATGTAVGMAVSKGIDHLASWYEKASSIITGSTNVYRSISSAEAANIMSTNQFNFAPGGMEAKQFAFSFGEALKFGNQSIINQTAIVKASIPNTMLGQFYSHNVDYGIFTGIITIDYETIGLFNEVVAGTIRIMP